MTLLKLISMKYGFDYNKIINKKMEYTDIYKSLNNVGIKTLQFDALFNENINEFPKVYS